MILVIDNYDSFTFNLVHYLQELGAEVRVERNDALTAREAVGSGAKGILLSPGPRTPNEAGITLDTVAACADAGLPLLGVCLGHQAIGQHFGGRVVQGGLMHGKTSAVTHDRSGVFAGLPSPFNATRYHSLVVEDIPEALHVNATSETPGLDGTSVMGFRHAELPIHGVQFHPESIATQHGHDLLANFLAICGIEARERQAA
ncbi:anthranilate synthase component II [Alteriqipengyuania lutimaris]|uniref:anthranilate synthase component II n=1 Tax=Alteriqipengyuania lutimaris TaxID=1538146 RepID=UPI001CFD1A23|nr:aminodeoxychorismate/anthranilate synthase component II [Alteriqipengyuania lutimaris]